MTGVLWAALAGVGFGLFQSTNRAAIEDLDVYRSTFIQLVVSAVILVVASVASGNLALLWGAPGGAVMNFAAAGLVHFFVGWTLLNASQKRLGAARTSPLIATAPLFGAGVAAATLGETPSALAWVGIVTTVAGVYVVGLERIRGRAPVRVGGPDGDQHPGAEGFTWKAASLGLGTALCWAISPVFIRNGLKGLDSPVLGVTISLVAAVLAYAVALLIRGRSGAPPASRTAMTWKLTAGVLVGLSTWARWYALSLTQVAVVLGLGLLSVPTVIVVAPLLVGRHVERITAPLVAGTALLMAGALVLIVWS
ncbi:MAG: EamA family transporter [Actinomycetota bacterium]